MQRCTRGELALTPHLPLIPYTRRASTRRSRGYAEMMARLDVEASVSLSAVAEVEAQMVSLSHCEYLLFADCSLPCIMHTVTVGYASRCCNAPLICSS